MNFSLAWIDNHEVVFNLPPEAPPDRFLHAYNHGLGKKCLNYFYPTQAMEKHSPESINHLYHWIRERRRPEDHHSWDIILALFPHDKEILEAYISTVCLDTLGIYVIRNDWEPIWNQFVEDILEGNL